MKSKNPKKITRTLSQKKEDKIFDAIIIGGGPAGISAAIYLSRFNRQILVIDKHTGRSSYDQVNDNFLGFPEGVSANKLRHLGERQAKKFGATFISNEIVKVRKRKTTFSVESLKHKYVGKSLILATGVDDIFPHFPNFRKYIGKSLFWCITCDGYRTKNKRVIVIGHTDEAVTACLQFLNYTTKLTFVLNCSIKQSNISQKMKKRLSDHSIPLIEGVIKTVTGANGMIKEVVLKDQTKIKTDYIFNRQGAMPNSVLAKELHVLTDIDGYIFVDPEQRTNIPFVYAAGDVTKPYSHQVITAAHEGSMAAQSANYDLYEDFQKE